MITEAFAPWVIVTALPPAIGVHSAGTVPAGLGWGAVAALFVGIIPFAFIVGWVARGRLTDHHVSVRSQRLLPLTVCLASLATGLGVLAVAGAPDEVTALVVAMGAGLVAAIAITVRWKVSVHALVAMGAVVMLVATFGPALLAAGGAAAAGVCWSRISLGDHTAAQVGCGTLVGALAGLLYVLLTLP